MFHLRNRNTSIINGLLQSLRIVANSNNNPSVRCKTTLPTKSLSSAVSYIREKLKFSEISALESLNSPELKTLPPNSNNNPSVRCKTTLRTKSQSSAVSYLREKLKFSEKSALEVLNSPKLKTLPPNSDSVIAFFEEQGCSRTRIRELIRNSPGLLCSDVKETLLPKIEFFRSKGASDRDVFSILFKSEAIVKSLEERIIPCFNVIAFGVGSDSKAIAVMRKQPWLLGWDLDHHLLPKIKTLRDIGVLESNIISMFNDDDLLPLINLSCGFLNECVEEVKGMGFDPVSEKFLDALFAYAGRGRDLKLYVFKRWGFSKAHVMEVFRRDPRVLEQDGDQIAAVMAFLVKQMGFRPFTVLNRPGVFGKCMKEWIIPRGWFAKQLSSRGLIEEWSLSELFECSEKAFVQRFVNQHKDKAPELLKLYNEKKQLAELQSLLRNVTMFD